MPADGPTPPGPLDGAPPPQEVAANVGAIVAEQVRRLIDSAERSADELHRRAVDDVSSDQEAVRHTAELVQERIDAIEAGVERLLRQLRAEVRQIADDAASGSRSPPQPADPGADAPPPADEPPADVRPAEDTAAAIDDAADRPTEDAAAATDDAAEGAVATTAAAEAPLPAPSPASAGRRWTGRFRRLQRRDHELRCAVCGRTPEPDEGGRVIKRWQTTGDVTLCPDCQAEGWR
jgi:hypothetical protein